MKSMAEERFEVCRNHPEKEAIFYLEKMLIEAGYPYFFNFWEDLRPVFGGEPDGDPEGIDWNEYGFMIEIGRPAGCGIAEISVCFNTKGDPKLLELLDMRMVIDKADATAEDGALYCGLLAEQAMEIIENYFKTA